MTETFLPPEITQASAQVTVVFKAEKGCDSMDREVFNFSSWNSAIDFARRQEKLETVHSVKIESA